MGQRKSKSSSYNVASVVSDKDFKYERSAASRSPDLTLQSPPPPVAVPEELTYDTKQVPAWVTESVFVDVLKTRVAEFEKITNFKAYSALKPGENYATVMLRVGIDVELKDHTKEHVSFMLKVPHDSEEMRQMLTVMNFFVCENEMYLDVFPELEAIYKAVGVEVCFAPKAYKLPDEVGNTVLMEDLSPHGYKNANRLECLDMEHTKIVLRQMAQFHAVSAHRVATLGPFADVIMNGVYGENARPIIQGMIASFATAFLNNVGDYKDGEKYKKIMADFFPRLVDVMVDMAHYDVNEFNVINHGDCWSNNILFKYDDDGKVVDVKFVDFQAPRFGPPVQDLYYFLMTSARIDIKLKHFDYLIRFYYDILVENLTVLGYPKQYPTMRELQTLLIKYAPFSVMPCIIVLPIVLYDSTELAHFDNFMSDGDDGIKFKNFLFANKRYRDYIEEILPWLFNRGMLELSAIKPKTDVKSDEVGDSAAPIAHTTNQAPEWVSEKYFAAVLQKNVANFKHITSFNAKSGTSSGDNYSATLLQVDVGYELQDGSAKDVSLMLKVEPTGKISNEFLNSIYTFPKEILMYTEYLPRFEQLYRDACSPITFGPKYFETPNEVDSKIILLENLRPRGFKIGDRFEGLDMEQTKCALAKLAEFHAASAYYQHVQNSDFPELFTNGIFTEASRSILEQMQDSFYNPFLDAVKTFNGSDEYIGAILESKDKHFDALLEISKKEENSFCVLNHGDMWTNNIMFQYDAEGKIENTYLIDYQMVRYGSPAQDLYDLLISSPSLEIKLENFDYFVRYYHENLVRSLNLLKYTKPIPTLKDLHTDLLRNGAWAYSATTGHLSAALLEPSENANIENFLGNSDIALDFKRRMFSSKRYRSHAEVVLPWLYRRGLLNFDLDKEAPSDIIVGLNVDGFAKITGAREQDILVQSA